METLLELNQYISNHLSGLETYVKKNEKWHGYINIYELNKVN